MMIDQTIQLEGKYVELHPMGMEHLEGLYEAAQAEDIWTYMPKKVQSKSDMEQLIKQALIRRDQGIDYPFVIFSKEQNRIVGSTRFLDISIPDKNLEIGWTWYNPSVWRTAANTECKFLLLQYCFDKLKLNRVQLKTDSRNVRSQNAIMRLGAAKEGTLRKHRVLDDGYIRDTVVFSIIDIEWPEVKQRLKVFLNQTK
ncbi:GNAT family N-acetyltransferase [Falsibacillus pallidus]|uniref:RimJ/RimL family protein N-acetyltransferase n=1 Tax=Falsibacillus pallidus TaxID=493781 RepID=A0A370GWI2_9BACI|nr:GNAT family protein [Falsibacillus pallidus]RDI48017.1 RimJ/RimL family protein N-acetyltransferase [Falsibacillus pallidus]